MAKSGFYSDDDWEVIRTTAGDIQGDLEQGVSSELTLLIGRYLDSLMDSEALGSGRKQRDAWLHLKQKAVEFQQALAGVAQAWPIDGCSADLERFQQLTNEVVRAESLAEWNADDFEKRARSRSGRQDPDRKALIMGVLQIWTHMLKRPLTITRSSTNKVGGPLSDFFEAVLRPVLKNRLPTGEGLRKIVDDKKRQRNKALARTNGTLKSKSKSKVPSPMAH